MTVWWFPYLETGFSVCVVFWCLHMQSIITLYSAFSMGDNELPGNIFLMHPLPASQLSF